MPLGVIAHGAPQSGAGKGAGVLIADGSERGDLPADAIQAAGPTGAGDTLAGEVIARLVGDGASLDDAVRAGMSAARELLASRL